MLTIIETRTKQFKRADRPSGTGRLRIYYFVQCSCGSEPFEIGQYYFESDGVCRSCGSTDKNSHKTHGESDGTSIKGRKTATPEYRIWKAMKNRCYNLKFKQYQDYGGRGIVVCERWLDSYENFLADMGRRPSNKHSIDRRDNDGPYAPENCHWATDKEQRRNCRTNHFVTINGVTKCVTDWYRELGIPRATFWWRKRNGWTDLEALGFD